MPETPIQKPILVAPLNWGLGHATRCIPIIRALQANGYTPILASDGAALELLKKEFPELMALELPSYHIDYPRNGKNFKWKMVLSLPKIAKAVAAERKVIDEWIGQYNLCGIISDNRLGVVSRRIPSVYITHQLNVLSGCTTWFSGKLHRHFIKRFSECWIPDNAETPYLSGKLGHLKHSDGLRLKYIGPLSRFERTTAPKTYELMILLSGPEPQRSLLEARLEGEISNYSGKIVFVKGVVEPAQQMVEKGNVIFYNFMTSAQLEKTLNESKLVLCRSGYTTIMDLAKLGKKAFFIPTPGQFEQEYLAEKLMEDGLAPFATQDNFSIMQLAQVNLYKGLSNISATTDWQDLFGPFQPM